MWIQKITNKKTIHLVVKFKWSRKQKGFKELSCFFAKDWVGLEQKNILFKNKIKT